MSSGKQYGLQIPKKSSQNLIQKHSIFGDDSNSDKSDGGGSDWLKKSLKRENTQQSVQKKQTKLDIQRALEQDATVYQYDEIYDQIEHQRQSKSQKDKDLKPRYIQKLMLNAEKRKIDNERRIERQVQKEREAEGEEFKDKETFVTSAYKKKLEEFAKLDAEQKRMDMLEDIGDVTKQQDISGFYRHLYQTTVSPKEEPQEQPKPKEGKTSVDPKKPLKDVKKDKRQYRKRKDSESSTDKNKDADTEGATSSSSSSGSESESEDEKSSESETEDPKRIRLKEYAESKIDQPTPSSSSSEKKPLSKISSPAAVELPQTQLPPPIINNKPLINIWEKRTVGPVFDAAYKRYLERKHARMTLVH